MKELATPWNDDALVVKLRKKINGVRCEVRSRSDRYWKLFMVNFDV